MLCMLHLVSFHLNYSDHNVLLPFQLFARDVTSLTDHVPGPTIAGKATFSVLLLFIKHKFTLHKNGRMNRTSLELFYLLIGMFQHFCFVYSLLSTNCVL